MNSTDQAEPRRKGREGYVLRECRVGADYQGGPGGCFFREVLKASEGKAGLTHLLIVPQGLALIAVRRLIFEQCYKTGTGGQTLDSTAMHNSWMTEKIEAHVILFLT